MVERANYKGRRAFKCEACGFHYANEVYAHQCEDYCRLHKSCSMEITKNSL